MTRQRKRTVSVATYRSDPLYPRIQRAVATVLQRGSVVTPIDILVEMGLLTPPRIEDWRRGRVPYLERVVDCNLTRLSRILRILRLHAHDLNLVPSVTVYTRWGKGPRRRLRFTKAGEPGPEEAYARHFVWPGKGPFHPPGPRMPTETMIATMVERIVQRFQPLRVILFGSHARGSAVAESDIDLLVVLREVTDKRRVTVEIRRALGDLLVSKDIVVTTPEEISRRGDLVGSVLRPALREGRILYEQQ